MLVPYIDSSSYSVIHDKYYKHNKQRNFVNIFLFCNEVKKQKQKQKQKHMILPQEIETQTLRFYSLML